MGIDDLMQVLHVYLMFMNKLNTNCLFLYIEKEALSLFKIAKTFPDILKGITTNYVQEIF